MSKWYQNGVEGIKVLMRILVGQRSTQDHNLTIYMYDETKFSSCHTPYINSILHTASSYYVLSHKKLFQAGNFNVNVRPDLLYFCIWGVYSKTYQKHNSWPMKTAKTLCTSSWRLVWWNVIHSTKISIVHLALKTKGQTLLNAPRSLMQVKTLMSKRWDRGFKSDLILLVIWFMTYLLRKYRGSVVIMVGRGGAEPHYVHNPPPLFSW